MVKRQRGDVIFVGSDVACGSVRTWAPVVGAPKRDWSRWSPTSRWSWRAPGAGVGRPPRTDPDRYGLEPAAESIAPALEDWAKWGQARHSYFLRAADLARAIAFVAETPRGGFVVSMELQPEAPLSDAPGTSATQVPGEP